MQDLLEITEHAIALTEELTADFDESHDLQHHRDVWANALLIMEGASERTMFMASVASLLHDVVDHKYPETYAVNKQRLIEFLTDVPDGDNIKWIIENISYSKEVKGGRPVHNNADVQAARDIVSDADKLEAIGFRGIKRCYQFTRAHNPLMEDDEVTETVIAHCHEKLLGLHNYIRTCAGKALAEPLTAEVAAWVRDNTAVKAL